MTTGRGATKRHKETLGVMIYLLLIEVMVSSVYSHDKIYQILYLNVHSVSYINYTSQKLLKII